MPGGWGWGTGKVLDLKGNGMERKRGDMIKSLPAMWETWVPSLGQEDPLETGMATHSSVLV